MGRQVGGKKGITEKKCPVGPASSLDWWKAFYGCV